MDDLPNAPAAGHSQQRVHVSQALAAEQRAASTHAPPSTSMSPALADASGEQPMSPAYYGVVIYMLSLASWVFYLAWAFLPDWVLHGVGVTYYPDRWWALAIPAWGVVTVAFIALYTQLHVLYHSPDMHSVATITDSFAIVKVSDSYDLHDLPLHEVSLNLHRKRRTPSSRSSDILTSPVQRNRGHTVI